MRILIPALVFAAIGIGAWRFWEVGRPGRGKGSGFHRYVADTYLQVLAVAAGILLIILIIAVSQQILQNI